MDKGRTVKLTMASLGMLILILDGKTALTGIREGLKVCMETLIPALFPFLFISSVISGNLPRNSRGFIGKLLKKFGVPEYAAGILPIGWLGGYPVGARCASKLFQTGSCSAGDATNLAVICNMAGPAFLFGVLMPFFQKKWTVFILWGIHLTAGVLAGSSKIRKDLNSVESSNDQTSSFATHLSGAIRAMANICGCVILFRMLLELLQRWFLWLIPAEFSILITGLLELSNGCLRLSEIQQEDLRFLMASVLLSFGGFCVLLQTMSLFPELTVKRYLSGKLLQTLYSILLASAVIAIKHGHPLPGTILLLGVFVSYGLRKSPLLRKQNYGSNPASFDV